MQMLRHGWWIGLPLIVLAAVSAMPAQRDTTQDDQSHTQSIADMVRRNEDVTGVTQERSHGSAAMAAKLRSVLPTHVFYMHGINAEVSGDSAVLRKEICDALGGCAENSKPTRIYAEGGPFASDAPAPALTYQGMPVWKTQEEWHAATPFILRYRLQPKDHIPILVDELNWFPLVLSLKCRALIAPEAELTGPDKAHINLCAARPKGTLIDPDHEHRYLQYAFIDAAEATRLERLPRHAYLVNRSLKNGLMDWGFGDAVLSLGPMEEILTAGVRDLLTQALATTGVNLSTARAEDEGPDSAFVTHSLGSYLALAALYPDWPNPASAALPAFTASGDQRRASDYVAGHTMGFYFLANQIELLDLARLSVAPSQRGRTESSASPPSESKPKPAAGELIEHWQSMRSLRHVVGEQPKPQIIAWSDPDDLLSWIVPQMGTVKVVNRQVRNAGFKVPPFLAWPAGAHDNYAENKKVVRVIVRGGE